MKVKQKILILYLPVIHQGYLDIFKKLKNKIDLIGILDADFVKEISGINPAIESLSFLESEKVLSSLDVKNIVLIDKKNIKKFNNYQKLLINDFVSREIAKKYFDKNIEWQDVFLRWDKGSVKSENEVVADISEDNFDQNIMAKAFKLASKSGDCWRQVGAVLIKNKKELLTDISKNNINKILNRK